LANPETLTYNLVKGKLIMVRDHALKVAQDYARFENMPQVVARVQTTLLGSESWNITRKSVWSSQLLALRLKYGTAFVVNPK
jgi:hypothetical protein